MSGAAEDRSLSPLTGWTRSHWENLADDLLSGLAHYVTPDGAFIQLPGSKSKNDALETFCRSFLLAAYRSRFGRDDFVGTYVEGLRVGTGAHGKPRWPRAEADIRVVVEAAFVVTALHETRATLWQALPDREQTALVDWLSAVGGVRVAPNNWLTFQIVVEAFLKSVGASHRQEVIDRNLDLVDGFYRGDGWYTDGPVSSYDYYVGWGIHFFLLMWCLIDGDASQPERAQAFRSRASLFLDGYRYLFAANGAPLYHGRSLIYRLSCAAPLWMGLRTGSTPLSPGLTRRIASGIIKHFVDRGAVRGSLLTAGWYGDFPHMRQFYSGRGSTYWCSQAFAGLALSPGHAAWTDTEEPSPIDEGDFCHALDAPGFILYGTCSDGIVRAASHRSDHYPLPRQRPFAGWPAPLRTTLRRVHGRLVKPNPPSDPHYRKLSYSTHTAPEQGRGDNDLDSQLTLVPAAEPTRRSFSTIALVDRFACSTWLPRDPLPTERVASAVIVRPELEIRMHHVSVAKPRELREGGFSVSGDRPPLCEVGPLWALTKRTDGLTSLIAGLHGYDRAGVKEAHATNPFGEFSATPFLERNDDFTGEAIAVSLVMLTGAEIKPEEVLSGLTVSANGRQIHIRFRDGEEFFVQLAQPEDVAIRLGTQEIRGKVRYARCSSDDSSYVLRS